MYILTSILTQMQQLVGQTDWLAVIRTALMFAVIAFAVGAAFRVVFGKQAKLTRAISASLSILMIYLAAVLIYLFLPDFRAELASLPFITVDEQRFILWNLSELSDGLLYGSILRLFLLAVLVNLLEVLLPEGDRFSTWYLWRCLTALAGLVGYRLICGLIDQYVPELLTEWAKPVVLGFWALILLSGVLKVLLTVVLTVVHPIIGALYAFFFSNLFGRQFSKSILTTLILVGLVSGLNRLGFCQFAFSDFSLLSYGPTCLILLGTLYLFGRFL